MSQLKSLISEMIESYLEEETELNDSKTGKQTLKHLVKKFGKKTGDTIRTKKYADYGYSRTPLTRHEENHITIAAHHQDIIDHLKKNGWQQGDILKRKNILHHPQHGPDHAIHVGKDHEYGKTDADHTEVKVYTAKHNKPKHEYDY